MDKAKITVHLSQRPTAPPLKKHFNFSELDAEETSATMHPHMHSSSTHQESPFLDEWSTWMTHESIDTYTPMPLEKRTSHIWLHLTLSISGAVITGFLLGFLVLQLFQADHPAQYVSGALDELHTEPYTFLQYGVYQSGHSAKNVQHTLQSRGFSAYIHSADKHTVFVGFAKSPEVAKSLSTILHNQQIEVFLKKIEVPSCINECMQQNEKRQLSKIILQSKKLIHPLSDITMQLLTTTQKNEFSQEQIRKLHQEQTILEEQFESAKKDFSHDEQRHIEKSVQKLADALHFLEDGRDTMSSAKSWAIQVSLLEVILLQKQLLET